MAERRFTLTPPVPLDDGRPVLDDEQRRVVAHRGPGALLVVGGPGTGKTTTLVESVAARATGGDLTPHLVLTWSRPAAQELRSRLVRRLGRTQVAPKVMTVHGFCHALVRRFGEPASGSPLRLLTAPEQEFRVRELLAGHDTSAWPADLAAAATTRGFATEVRAVLARTRQLGMDPSDVVHAGRRALRPEWVAVGEFFDDYLDVLDAEGALDYAELVHRSRLLLLEAPVREALAAELATVHVDEFAECDPSQVRLLADLAGLGCQVVAFADPSTAVFAFRGADLRAVADFDELFTAPGRPAGRIDLVVGHRQGVHLGAACTGIARRLPANGSGPSPTPAAGLPAGRVRATVHDSVGAMVDHVADTLRQAHLDGGLGWSSMAVMTRSGRGDLPLLARGLAAAGVPVEVAGDEIALAEELAVRPLLLGLEVAATLAGGAAPEPDAVVRLLRSPLGGLDSLALRRLGRLLRAHDAGIVVEGATLLADHRPDGPTTRVPGEVWAGLPPVDAVPPGDDEAPFPDEPPFPDDEPPGVDDALAVPPPPDDDAPSDDELRLVAEARRTEEAMAALLARPSSVLVAELVTDPARALALADDEGRLPDQVAAAVRLGELLAQVAGVIRRGGTAQVALWTLWNGTGWPDHLRRQALAGDDTSARAHRDLDAVVALFDLAARDTDLVGDKGVRALVAEVAGQQIYADTAREGDLREVGVRLVTAHRAKGEQWPLVVVVGVQEGTWPNLARRGTLLEPDRLTRDGVLPPSPTSGVLAEERRLFHLACSRATRELHVCAVRGVEGEGEQPSRFLAELGVEVVDVPGRARRAMTIPALVAELRRAATDPSANPALRRAAASRLAELADQTDRRGRRLAPGADPHSWWGVLDYSEPDERLVAAGEPITLSGSSVEALLDCPRHWFLARQARAEAQRGSAAPLGSVVHVLAQHAMADDLDEDELAEHLEQVWAQLRFDAPWLSASERVEAELALERFAAWAQASQGRELLGVEVPFTTEVQLDGEVVRLTGTVDRLERDADGRLHVVDFKTGRSVPTQAAVDHNDQLGVYQLAAQQGAFDHLAPGERRVAGAQLVYLRKQDGQLPWPKVLSQPSLDEVPHQRGEAPSEAADGAAPTWVHEHLAAAARTIRDEDFAASRCQRCQTCPFALSCPAMTAEEVGR